VTALAATEHVLTEAGEPLNYREITCRILDRELWKTSGKTPDATLRALIYTDIASRGPDSRFQRSGNGTFALRAWGLPEPDGRKRQGTRLCEPGQAEIAADALPEMLSFADAAEQVLNQFGGKEPMHYRAITRKVLELGLVRTASQSPEQTLYAQVLTRIEREARRGDTPRFTRHGKGMVGLSRWSPSGLALQIEQQNNGVRKQFRARLFQLSPGDFETVIGKLLVAIGFEEVAVTGRSGDGGIDVRGTLVVGDVIRTRMAVQVKRWKNNVQAPVVQQVRGSLGTHEQGLIISTSDFSAGARSEAERPNAVPVALMNGEQLVALLVEHDLGVRRTSHYLIELGEAEDE
jgi:restriction system protein